MEAQSINSDYQMLNVLITEYVCIQKMLNKTEIHMSVIGYN